MRNPLRRDGAACSALADSAGLRRIHDLGQIVPDALANGDDESTSLGHLRWLVDVQGCMAYATRAPYLLRALSRLVEFDGSRDYRSLLESEQENLGIQGQNTERVRVDAKGFMPHR